MTSVAPRLRATRRRARQVPFLFNPVAVAQHLVELPYLATALGDPYHEGERASNLPGARKSARQLYRVLGNTHYEHLGQLLATLDACVGAGFTQPRILRTRARSPFAEALAELQAAEHFRRAGFAIAGFDDSKGSGSVPDILVKGNGVTAAVEVYCPRAWRKLAEYKDAIRDRLKNLDRGIDFEFRIAHEQLHRFDSGMGLLQLHPAQVSSGLDEHTGLEATGSLLADVETELDAGSSARARARFELPAVNLVTTVELSAVSPASSALPSRTGEISGPSFGGYRPEAMFADVAKRVIEKLREGQAVGIEGDALPVLVVEMSRSELTTELRDAFYRHEFENTLNAELPHLHGYGVVAFCEAFEWGKRLTPHFLVVDDDVTSNATARRLFP